MTHHVNTDHLIDEMSTRAYHAMLNSRALSLEELSTKTEKDMLRIKNVGKKTIKELQSILAKAGLQFKSIPKKRRSEKSIKCRLCGRSGKTELCKNCTALIRSLKVVVKQIAAIVIYKEDQKSESHLKRAGDPGSFNHAK